MTETVVVRDLSNREFLARNAGPGRVRLSGGTTLLDRAICRAERHQRQDGRWGVWTHAFVFQGTRADEHLGAHAGIPQCVAQCRGLCLFGHHRKTRPELPALRGEFVGAPEGRQRDHLEAVRVPGDHV